MSTSRPSAASTGLLHLRSAGVSVLLDAAVVGVPTLALDAYGTLTLGHVLRNAGAEPYR